MGWMLLKRGKEEKEGEKERSNKQINEQTDNQTNGYEKQREMRGRSNELL